MTEEQANADSQTLRFVQSLPKRERVPLKNKFKNADPQGVLWQHICISKKRPDG